VTIIMYNLLCAMNFLHTANVMHRDLKPANILIDDECLIKLCDFGMSRTCVEESETESLTPSRKVTSDVISTSSNDNQIEEIRFSKFD